MNPIYLPKRLPVRLVLLFFICYCAKGTCSSSEAILLDNQQIEADIFSHLDYLIDTTKALTVTDVILGNQSWIRNKKKNLSFGPAQANHWIRFSLKNTSDQDMSLILNLEYAHLAHFQIHVKDKDGIASQKVSGDNYQFENRDILHPHFVYQFNLKRNHVKDVFIQFDQEGQDLPIPISLSSSKHFFAAENNTRIIHGFSFGLTLLIIMGLLGLYFLSRTRFFLLQVIASIFSLFYVFAEEGYGFMYLWGGSPIANGISRPLSLGIVTIFSLLFTCEFLNYKKESSNIYRSIKGLCFIYLVYMILAHPLFLLPINSDESIGSLITFFLLFSAFLTLTNICLCIYKALWKNSTDAKVLLGVFGITLFAILIRTFAFQSGMLNTFIKHTGIITLTSQTVLIGFYLFYKFIQIMRENQNIKLAMAGERQKASEAIVDSLHKERERISMDIHDSLASLLSAAKLNLEALREKHIKIDKEDEFITANSLLVKIGGEMRSISQNLMPKTLKTFGIIAELEKHIRALQTKSSINFNFEYSGFESRLPERVELELYYISMEVLDNIVKYSEAQNVLIQFNKYSDDLHVIYDDDGIGFSKDEIRSGASGLVNIKNRITWLNGVIDIDSKKSQGTTITINLPL